jgi:predicted Zn-dependent protease
MSTHPRTVDRVERAIENAGATAVANPIIARDIYLKKIDGLLYGDDPSEGIISGQQFLHPTLRFAFAVPEGFTLHNSAAQVVATGPDSSAIVFDRAPRPSSRDMIAYLTREWAGNIDLRDVERIEINGMDAATGIARLSSRGGPVDVRLVAIRYDADTIYRFLFITPPDLTERRSNALRETTYSFRQLTAREAEALEPLRIQVVTVQPGDTVESLAKQMPFADYREQRFRVLNGLTEDARLTPGQKVKIITG